jgi:hypothetical protein
VELNGSIVGVLVGIFTVIVLMATAIRDGFFLYSSPHTLVDEVASSVVKIGVPVVVLLTDMEPLISTVLSVFNHISLYIVGLLELTMKERL